MKVTRRKEWEEGRVTSYFDMKLAEVARLFGVCERTVRNRAAAGEIPAYRNGSKWGFVRAEVMEHLKAQRVRR